MRTLIIFLLLATNVYADQVCWGINGKIKYFPTMAETDTFIASLPDPKYTDKIDFNRSGQPEQGGGTIYWDKICYSVVCGDAFCDRAVESCTTCPQDCGTCTNPNPYCGDGTCDVDENCSTCERDCGACPPPPPPPSGWTYCADENGQCNFTGTREVQYGANGLYFVKTFTNGTPCTNAVFGDPIAGTVKKCSYGPEVVVCVPDGSCNAPPPSCDQISQGTDNCGNPCGVVGLPCLTFTTLTAFEKWLTTTSIKGADTSPIIKGIKVGTSPNYKYYKVTITAVNGN